MKNSILNVSLDAWCATSPAAQQHRTRQYVNQYTTFQRQQRPVHLGTVCICQDNFTLGTAKLYNPFFTHTHTYREIQVSTNSSNRKLTLKEPSKIGADDTYSFSYFYLLKKMRLDVSCESSVWQRIHMNIKSYFL